jgi:hypothetical protein
VKLSKPHFEKLVFELRYAKGHLYLDRCGETLIQIEQKLPQWIPQEINPSGGLLANLDKDISFRFDSYRLGATQENPKTTTDFQEHVAPLIDIVCKNLLLSEFIRIGVRFFFLFPATSTEHAEEMVRQLNFFNISPNLKETCGPTITVQRHIVIFENENEGRRVEIGGVRREHGKLASKLLEVEPRLLPKGQREALSRRIQDTKRHEEDPRFAMQLDIDNYERQPESFNFRAFIERHEEFIRDKFFKLLGGAKW